MYVTGLNTCSSRSTFPHPTLISIQNTTEAPNYWTNLHLVDDFPPAAVKASHPDWEVAQVTAELKPRAKRTLNQITVGRSVTVLTGAGEDMWTCGSRSLIRKAEVTGKTWLLSKFHFSSSSKKKLHVSKIKSQSLARFIKIKKIHPSLVTGLFFLIPGPLSRPLEQHFLASPIKWWCLR